MALWCLLALPALAAGASYMLDTSYSLPSALRNTFAEPTKISSSNGALSVTLSVEAYRVTNELFSYTTRAYCYNGVCAVPGPTISVKPGDTLTIILENNLAYDNGVKIMNTMHTPNVTNIHTHGLHIGPDVDNIFISVNGGETHTYVYNIPRDHTPGTHWYHSHLHGTSGLHVMGGLVGALIVEPYYTTDLPSALQIMTHKVMVFTHVMLDRIGGDGTGDSEDNTDPFTVLPYSHLSSMTSSTLDINPVINVDDSGSTVWDAWFVNGQYQPTLTIKIRTGIGISGGTQLGGDSGTSASCSWYLLALDGIYLSSSRKSSSYEYVKHLVMIAGQRASIAIKCATAGSYYFQTVGSTTDSTSSGIGDLEIKSQQILFHLTVSGTTSTTYSNPPTTLGVTRPYYLTSLQSKTISSGNKWSMSVEQTGCCGNDDNAFYWLGVGTNCTLDCFGREDCIDKYGDDWDVSDTYPVSSGQCEYESFIGEIGDSWSDDYRHYAQLGTPQELTIWGRGGSAHPIHVHVTLMQFISHVYYPNGKLKDMSSPFAEEGDWRDTWPALPGKSTLRMNFSNHTGEYVTHCHFLKHEDMGMMTTFFVDSATSSPSYSPTSKPTTRKPTVKPTTAKPTAKPSTATPTVVPSTSKPSFTPSSATPSTAKPTMTPSTATPSTAIPTVAPSTAVPTEFPTLAPISGTKTIVTFSTSLSMSNVTVDDINNDEFKMTFKIAIMSALEAQDFPVSEVTNIKVESTALVSHRGTLDSLYSSIESVWRTLYYFFIDENSLQSSTSSLSYVNNNVVTSGSGGATVSYDILLVLENSIYTDPTSASAVLTSILSSTSCITSVETDLNSGGYSVSSVSSGTTTVTETTTVTDDDGGEEATTLALWIIIVVIVVGVSVLLVIASIIRKIRSEGYKDRTKFELGSDHDMDEAVELAERQSVAVTYESVYSENNSSINSTMALTSVGTPTTQLSRQD